MQHENGTPCMNATNEQSIIGSTAFVLEILISQQSSWTNVGRGNLFVLENKVDDDELKAIVETDPL